MSTYRSTISDDYPSLRPLGTRVFLQPMEDSQEAGGILLPEKMFRTDMRRCKVIGRGAMVTDFELGQTVLLRRQLTFNRVKLMGKDCMIVPQEHILAIED